MTIKLTEQEFSELLSNAWHAANSDSDLTEQKAIYINQQIDKYFPYSKPITTPVIETEEEPKYKMDIYFSVFNYHINNASERAQKDVIAKFGKAQFNEKIKPLIDTGIMAMFKESPTEITKYFAEQITEYVNEDRIEKPKEENEYVS